MRVEPGRDDHEVGLERPDRRLDDVLERRFVLGVARARGERDVDDPLPVRVRPARSRPERPLVQRHREDARIVTEQRLGAVPVVHVEVDDRDARGTELRLRVARRDGDVPEHAEAHRLAPAARDGRVGERARSRRPRRPGSRTLRRDTRPPTSRCWHRCPGRARPRRRLPRSSRRRRGRARARAAPASPGCRRHTSGSSRGGTAAGRGARDCRSSPGTCSVAKLGWLITSTRGPPRSAAQREAPRAASRARPQPPSPA